MSFNLINKDCKHNLILKEKTVSKKNGKTTLTSKAVRAVKSTKFKAFYLVEQAQDSGCLENI